MISIKAATDKKHLYLSAEGHADYMPGNDIVCAAVSALFCTLAINSQNAKLYPGDSFIVLSNNAENRAVYKAILSGLCAVAESFSAHVRVEVGASADKINFFSEEMSNNMTFRNGG